MEIIFHPDASKEYLEACNWYEEAAEGLGKRFKAAIVEQIALIINNPQAYPKKRYDYRESVVKVFPYVIVYHCQASKKYYLYYCNISYQPQAG